MEETLTDFCALLEDDDADFAAVLLLELFQTDGSAKACGPSANNADIHFVGCAFDCAWVKEFPLQSRGRRVKPSERTERRDAGMPFGQT